MTHCPLCLSYRDRGGNYERRARLFPSAEKLDLWQTMKNVLSIAHDNDALAECERETVFNMPPTARIGTAGRFRERNDPIRLQKVVPVLLSEPNSLGFLGLSGQAGVINLMIAIDPSRRDRVASRFKLRAIALQFAEAGVPRGQVNAHFQSLLDMV